MNARMLGACQAVMVRGVEDWPPDSGHWALGTYSLPLISSSPTPTKWPAIDPTRAKACEHLMAAGTGPLRDTPIPTPSPRSALNVVIV